MPENLLLLFCLFLTSHLISLIVQCSIFVFSFKYLNAQILNCMTLAVIPHMLNLRCKYDRLNLSRISTIILTSSLFAGNFFLYFFLRFSFDLLSKWYFSLCNHQAIALSLSLLSPFSSLFLNVNIPNLYRFYTISTIWFPFPFTQFEYWIKVVKAR